MTRSDSSASTGVTVQFLLAGIRTVSRVLDDRTEGAAQRWSARREFEGFVADATPSLMRTAYLLTWSLAESEDLVQRHNLASQDFDAQRYPPRHERRNPKKRRG
jgi:hypothetical protein